MLIALLLASGCAVTRPLDRTQVTGSPQAQAHADSLCKTVETLAGSHIGNFGRFAAVRRRAAQLGLAPQMRTEWIDWFTVQRNAVIEFPGSSGRIVYISAHYDKIDVNPLTVLSVFANGLFDPVTGLTVFSQGAADNATGIAVALELAAWLKGRQHRDTYRILLTGSEESGLRGARAHVARITPAEAKAIRLAINVDEVGVDFSPNAVTAHVSDPGWTMIAEAVARRLKVELKHGKLTSGASSDFAPFRRNSFLLDFGRGLKFNFIAGLLPQRSWFATPLAVPVLNFTTMNPTDDFDLVAGTVFLPVGRIHSPRDRLDRVSPRRLYEQFSIIQGIIEEIEKTN